MHEEITAERAVRFWSYVDRSGGCWLWTGGKAHNGYGIFRNGRHSPKAHRVAYVLAGGDLPPYAILRHTCDTPACVRPDHLLTGSQADNIQDCWGRGRAAPRRKGESNEGHKLTFQQVQEIRAAYTAGGVRQVDLARRYGVSQVYVSDLVRMRRRIDC